MSMFAPLEGERGMAGREQFNLVKRQACETVVVRLDGTKQVLGKVNFAALEHREALASSGLDDFHFDIRKALRIPV